MSAQPFTVQPVPSPDDLRWSFLQKHSLGFSVFQREDFLKIIESEFGIKPVRYLCLKRDEPKGGVVVFVRSRNRISVALTPYFIFYNSIVTVRPESERLFSQIQHQHHVENALLEFLETEYPIISFHTWPHQMDVRAYLWRNWQAVPAYTTLLKINNLNELWENVDKDVRRLIRKGAEDALRFETQCEPGDLFRLLHQTYEKDALTPPIPEKQFVSFAGKLVAAGLASICGVFDKNSQLLAGALVLEDKPTIFGLFLGRNTQVQPNPGSVNLLWHIAEHYSNRGFTRFDLGGAMISSIANFKLKMGASLLSTYQLMKFKNSWYKGLYQLNRLRHTWLRHKL